MTAAKKLEGTCPACFRTYALDSKGFVTRHGWREIGGRQVGQYGNAEHVGNCFGVGRLPFEVSAEGTVAFSLEVVFPSALAAQGRLARLATRPEIIRTSSVTAYSSKLGVTSCPYSIRFVPGDVASYPGFSGGRVPSYEEVHAQETEREANGLELLLLEGRDLEAKIAAWAPATLVERAPKKATVHLESATRPGNPACRFARHYSATAANVSKDRAEVTCSRCLR